MAAVKKAAEREVAASLDRAARAIDVGGISDRQAIDLVKNSPMGRHALAETMLAKQQRREELRSLIDEERENCEREGSVLQRRNLEAIAARETKQKELEAADNAVNEARAAIAARTLFRNHMVARCETELESLIPPEVTQFGKRCDAGWEEWRANTFSAPHYVRMGPLVIPFVDESKLPGEPTEVIRKLKENTEALDKHNLEGESFGAASRAALALTLPEGSEELRDALEQIWENRLDHARRERAAGRPKT